MLIKYLEQYLVKIGLNLYFSLLPASRKAASGPRASNATLSTFKLGNLLGNFTWCQRHERKWGTQTSKPLAFKNTSKLPIDSSFAICNVSTLLPAVMPRRRRPFFAFLLVDVAEAASVSHKLWGARPRMQTGRTAAAAAEMSEEAGELWQDLTKVSSIATGMERWVAESGQGRATRPRLFLWLTVRTWCLILASHQ